MARNYKPRRPQKKVLKSDEERDALVRKMKETGAGTSNYRDQSLKRHGWICAKCGREFEANNLQLLTVHHKDGNHNNNPPDGSNWENLCVYCHDDEYSRSLLGDYLSDADEEN